MNWINSAFYGVIAWTGFCWLFTKIRLLHPATPRWVMAGAVWFAEFFWVILIIFIIRSLLWEPFRIPSASMMPTLEANDFILVNKYDYGMKLPGIPVKLTAGRAPQRGDVVVFRYPPQPSQDYIKRLIGLPGDVVRYQSQVVLENDQLKREKILTINGEVVHKSSAEVSATPSSAWSSLASQSGDYQVFVEKLGDRHHWIRELSSRTVMMGWPSFENHADACEYALPDAFTCKVPAGYYFMMGDNRDESADSRYWGFVPEDHMVGRAFLIWMNTWKFDRIGKIQ